MNQPKKVRSGWYVRHDGAVEGPLTKAALLRRIVGARIDERHEISHDLRQWRTLTEIPELVPDRYQRETELPLVRQRLYAAARWEGRSAESDLQAATSGGGWQGREWARRNAGVGGGIGASDLRERLTSGARLRRWDRLWAGLIAGGVLAGLLALVYYFKPVPPSTMDHCEVPPGPGVDWSNCHLPGLDLAYANLIGATMKNMDLSAVVLAGGQLVNADLSYTLLPLARLDGADLRSVRLVGANLRGAVLTRTNLSAANLSYADLSGADLSGANLTDTILANTIWIDGRVCGQASIGICAP